jgi:hypothetical protein
MGYTRGESYATGVAVEGTRGTFAAAQDYIRSREPGSIQTLVEKVDIKETKVTGMNSQGQVVTMTKVEGELPFNLRFRTIGYLLKSLLGGVNSSAEAGETVVYRHAITLDPAVQQPTLSLSLARGEFDHKRLNGAVVSALSFAFPVDDVVNGVATIKGRTETTATDFTAGYAEDDYLAPHQMVTLKIAEDVAGLSGATGICVTDLSLLLDRGSREKLCLSSVSPVDHIAKLLTVTGAFNFEKSDDTYRDLAIANTSRALQISVVNTAQEIGVDSNPTLTITLPNVTFTTSESRPLDDLVTEEVSFTANYDDAEGNGITISLVNEKANYNA